MIQYDPFSEEVISDPFPVYARLRRESPVYFIEKYECWALSRFQDIWDACSDNHNFSTSRGTAIMQLCTRDIDVIPTLNSLDPPVHTEVRSGLRRYFMPRAVARIEPEIRRYARDLLTSSVDDGRLDAVSQLAAPISLRAACLMNGFPVEDEPVLADLVQRYFRRERGIVGMPPDAVLAAQDMVLYLQDLVRCRRRSDSDADDPIAAYLALDLDGRRLDDYEIACHATLLLMGAVETFPKVFANTVLRLFQNPGQRARLVSDAKLVPHAFWETLRIDMPTQHLGRTLVNDVELRGRTMRAGESVLFLYAAANRDETEFDLPEVFDIDRRAKRILGFGQGTHRCLGAQMAEMEGRVLLEEFLDQIPDYEVHLDDAKPLWTEFVRGFASLPVVFEGSRAGTS